MQRKSLVRLAMISLVAGVVMTALLYRAVLHSRAAHPTAAPAAVQPIVVANSVLSRGSRLEIAQVKLVPWPDKTLPTGSIHRPESVVGRILKTDVVAHEPLLESKLLPTGVRPGLSSIIQPGYRAVGIKVNEVTSVAGFALPGTRVDVLMTATPRDARESVTKTILKDVLVLTAGPSLEDSREGKPSTITEVTLQVTPEDAEKLSLAATDGKVNLSIRNHQDHDLPSTPGVRMATLVDEIRARPLGTLHPVPRRTAPAAPRVHTVDLILGSKRTSQSF